MPILNHVRLPLGILCAVVLAFENSVAQPWLSFVEHAENPVLAATGEGWESHMISHASAVVRDTTIYLLYSAKDRSGPGIWNGTARIGLAYSTDGIHFTREAEPVIKPTFDFETPGGCDHPIVTEIDSVYYMTYTAFDGFVPRLALASSADLTTWRKHELIFPDSGWTRAGCIVPQQLNGRYVMYFSDGWLRLAESFDLLHWVAKPSPIQVPSLQVSDSVRIEPSASFVTDDAILLLCNVVDGKVQGRNEILRFHTGMPERVVSAHEKLVLKSYEGEENQRKEKIMPLKSVIGIAVLGEGSFMYYRPDDATVWVAVGEKEEERTAKK